MILLQRYTPMTEKGQSSTFVDRRGSGGVAPTTDTRATLEPRGSRRQNRAGAAFIGNNAKALVIGSK
jgi:hypothetical protein